MGTNINPRTQEVDEIKINTKKQGLEIVYPRHTAKLLQRIWDIPPGGVKGLSVKDLHDWYNHLAEERGMKSKSRSTIFKALEELRADDVIGFYEVDDRGGPKRMYYALMSPVMLREHVKDTVGVVFNGPWWKP